MTHKFQDSTWSQTPEDWFSRYVAHLLILFSLCVLPDIKEKKQILDVYHETLNLVWLALWED